MAHGILLSCLREDKVSVYENLVENVQRVGSLEQSPSCVLNLGIGAGRRNKQLKNTMMKVGILVLYIALPLHNTFY